MPELVNVGGENWDVSYAGGGLADSVAQIVKSIQSDDAFSVVANGVTAGLDLLGVLDSPIRAVAESVVGWLIEHVAFLDMFLDVTAGDPALVEAAVKALQDTAVALDKLAGEHIDALAEVPTYAEGGSGSFNAFFANVMPRAEEITALSLACLGQASGLTVDAVLVAATRGIIRDGLAAFVVTVIERAATAAAAAPLTGGGSVAMAVCDTVLEAGRLTNDLIDELARLSARLSVVSGKLAQLGEALGFVAKNILTSTAKGADMSSASPELTAADRAAARREPPRPPAPAYPWRVQGTLDDE